MWAVWLLAVCIGGGNVMKNIFNSGLAACANGICYSWYVVVIHRSCHHSPCPGFDWYWMHIKDQKMVTHLLWPPRQHGDGTHSMLYYFSTL